MQGKIIKVAGPLVVADGMRNVKIYDMVKVGEKALIGEVIELRDNKASIQVYEDTTGLKVGEIVESVNSPLSIELGPGLLGNIFDGIGRSLSEIYKTYGERVVTGVSEVRLNHEKVWSFVPSVEVGDDVKTGDVLGEVQETGLIKHKILVPNGICGTVMQIKFGEFTLDDIVAKIKTENGVKDVTMLTKWPVRQSRPYVKKIPLSELMPTGQRIIDTFFPTTRGGVSAVPGPFGSGKTVIQHQLAKWCDADVVVYIGCGERGNEITDVLNEFPELKDPESGRPLMERTILIANTSDMPVAAREASIYTGITIAEYFRDMGYDVVIMADSTSRWAEAMREMSGRLEEMPGEDGYPAYLASRIASFYERAGLVECLGSDARKGSVTAIGAVSPQGGDLSEPVSQATLRVVQVFWGLSAELANKRHFPSIDWLASYSRYSMRLAPWYKENVSYDFVKYKTMFMKILKEEAELNEVVQLVGFDVLGDKDKTTLDIARIIREDYLQQDAFDDIDCYTSLQKQNKMLKLIYNYAIYAYKAIESGKTYDKIISIKFRNEIGRMKYIKEEDIQKFDELENKLYTEFASL